MNYANLFQQRFQDSIQVKKNSLEQILEPLSQAGEQLIACLKNHKKVLVCGNGGSAADAQHFAAELVVRYETNRQSLPALALTTDSSILTATANDFSFEKIFSRQIEGLAQAGDLLVAISTSGNSNNVIEAVKAAQTKQMNVLVFSGGGGGKIRSLLKNQDVEICVPSTITGRIQETHILIMHCLCEIADHAFSGEPS